MASRVRSQIQYLADALEGEIKNGAKASSERAPHMCARAVPQAHRTVLQQSHTMPRGDHRLNTAQGCHRVCADRRSKILSERQGTSILTSRQAPQPALQVVMGACLQQIGQHSLEDLYSNMYSNMYPSIYVCSNMYDTCIQASCPTNRIG